MKLTPVLLVLGALIMVGGVSQAAGRESHRVRPSLDWIYSSKVRAGYLSSRTPIEITRKMTSLGMNTVLVKFQYYSPGDPEALKQIEEWSRAADDAKLRLFVTFNFAGYPEIKTLDRYRREVDRNGKTLLNTPCPLDKNFWEDQISARFVELAKLSRKVPIAGAALDPEMYAADHSLYIEPCYCNSCWSGFLADYRERHGAESLPATSRYLWLIQKLRMADYVTWHMKKLTNIAAEIEQKTHAQNPDFMIGVLLADRDEWFMKALRFGLGTAKMPLVAWSENTYIEGYGLHLINALVRIEREGSHCLLVGGLWNREFSARHVAEHLYHMARASKGYWIYTLESMMPATDKLPEMLRLREPAASHWLAIHIANQEIERCLKNGADRKSYLAIRPSSGFPPDAPEIAPVVLNLKPIGQGGVALPLKGIETALRGPNIIFARATYKEVLHFRLDCSQVGSYRSPTSYVLLDPDGNALKRGTIEYGKKVEVSHQAHADGIYALSINSAENACRVSCSSSHVSYLASEKQPLSIIWSVRPLYFMVPEGISNFSVVLTTAGDGEAVRVRLLTQDGKERWSHTVSGMVRADIAVPSGEEGIWSIHVDRVPNAVFEDLKIMLEPPLSPYLSDHPARLLGP